MLTLCSRRDPSQSSIVSTCAQRRTTIAVSTALFTLVLGNAPPGGSHCFSSSGAPSQPDAPIGEAGCQPIAEFWGQLSSPALSDAQRVERLQAFFYQCVVVEGTALPPALHFDHFRGDLGQLRTNNFIMQGANGRPKWQLRELRTAIVDGGPGLVADTVKDTPIAELFGGNFRGGPGGVCCVACGVSEDSS